MSALQTTLSTN